jgi:hypothetical protein
MRLSSKPRPVLASFVAAAAALAPLLTLAVYEIANPALIFDANGQVDDAGLRGAGATMIAAPFLFIAGVPMCFAAGRLLVAFRLQRLGGFIGGAAVLALFLGLLVGGYLGLAAGPGASQVLISIATTSLLLVVSSVPAACCWWFLAVQPHNTPLNPDAPPTSGAPVS